MATIHIKDLIEGFDADLQLVINQFQGQNTTTKLDDFINYWDKNKLDCLFANRFDPRELVEAIRHMNQILVETLCNKETEGDLSRVIALYFLLLIFFKQPEQLRSKIRLNCEDAVFIQNKCNQDWSENKDLIYAWNCLRRHEAIDFVEDRQIYGPSMLFSKCWRKISEQKRASLKQLAEEVRDSITFLDDKIEPELQELEAYLSQYEYVKSQINLPEGQDNIETGVDLRECLNQARALITEFRTKSKQP